MYMYVYACILLYAYKYVRSGADLGGGVLAYGTNEHSRSVSSPPSSKLARGRELRDRLCGPSELLQLQLERQLELKPKLQLQLKLKPKLKLKLERELEL